MRFGSPEAIRFSKAIVLTIVFLSLVCLPTLDSMFHLDHAPIPNEKRLLAPFPTYRSISQLRDFMAGFGQFYDDHFGFRRRLIRAENHWKRELFQTPPAHIMLGRDGWLYTSGDRMLDHYLGFSRFTARDLEAWQKLLERRRDWLAQRGCKYVFVIAPDKQSVYPEHLPEWIVKSDKPSKVEQLVEHMRQHSTVAILDLRPSLLEARKLGPLFLKTDTHWNELGAFVAYQGLATKVSESLPQVSPAPLSAFECKPAALPAGDLASILGDTAGMETQHILLLPSPDLPAVVSRSEPALLPRKWPKDMDPVVAESKCGEGEAILFHDSFGRSWADFLARNFRRVVCLWQYNLDPDFIQREKAQIVISEMLERVFNTEDPQSLMASDHLPQ